MDYTLKVNEWKNNINLDIDLKKELDSYSEEELKDAFYTDLVFGTGGLRGILGAGTNRMNIYVVAKTTLGFCHYMQKKYPDLKNMGVVISYDCRKNSYLFASTAATIIASLGIKAYLFDKMRSTPELSFAVRSLKCAGGIMITASHNPPIYNGYKVYDHEGCQLVPLLADMVIDEINKIDKMLEIKIDGFEEYLKSGLIQIIGEDIDKQYLKAVKSVQVQDVLKNNIKIVYTPLHGTGASLMENLLTSEGYDIYPVQEQMIADPNFSTLVLPNPEESSAYDYAIKLGKKIHADILIATDPDADRMGIACLNKNGEYVLLTGNQTGAILLDYLAKFKNHSKNSIVYNTIVSSNIAKAITEEYGLTLVQTLTGFKFIGEQAALIKNTNQEFFFGYEESYGYVIKDFVRDKDSFQATLLLSEVASYYKEKSKTLLDALEDIYSRHGYYQEGVENISLVGIEGSKRINKIMTSFQNMNLSNIAGKKIYSIEDYDKGIKITNGIKTKLSLPRSFVLKYIFEDGGWFVLRPSGTEPKLKIYIAIKADTKVLANNLIEKLKESILKLIKEI